MTRRRTPREIYRVHDGEEFHVPADLEQDDSGLADQLDSRSGHWLVRLAGAAAVLGAVGSLLVLTRPTHPGRDAQLSVSPLHTVEAPQPERRTVQLRREHASSRTRRETQYGQVRAADRRRDAPTGDARTYAGMPARAVGAPTEGAAHLCGAGAEFGFEGCHR